MIKNANSPIHNKYLSQKENVISYINKLKGNNFLPQKNVKLKQLQNDFANLFKIKAENICLTENGFSALTNTISTVSKSKYCLTPSWAPASIAYAIHYAGYIPFFIDVDKDSWSLEPEIVKENLSLYKDIDFGCVIVPISFGHSTNTSNWDKLTKETGIPVIIDATSSFDALLSKPTSNPTKTPIIINFEQDNLLGIEGGGLVISRDNILINDIQSKCGNDCICEKSNFSISKFCVMSEEKASIYIDTLSKWPSIRAKWFSLTSKYLESLIDTTLSHKLSFEFLTTTCNIHLSGENCNEVIDLLKANNIEAYKLWGNGCHNIEDFKDMPKSRLDVTENLAKSVIAVPFHTKLTLKDINHIVSTLNANINASTT